MSSKQTPSQTSRALEQDIASLQGYYRPKASFRDKLLSRLEGVYTLEYTGQKSSWLRHVGVYAFSFSALFIASLVYYSFFFSAGESVYQQQALPIAPAFEGIAPAQMRALPAMDESPVAESQMRIEPMMLSEQEDAFFQDYCEQLGGGYDPQEKTCQFDNGNICDALSIGDCQP